MKKVALITGVTGQHSINGVYRPTTTTSTNGAYHVYENKDINQDTRYMWWEPSYGGEWLVDSDLDNWEILAYIPATNRLTVNVGNQVETGAGIWDSGIGDWDWQNNVVLRKIECPGKTIFFSELRKCVLKNLQQTA